MNTEQIISRIEERKKNDPFGFEWGQYVRALPFDAARKFLRADANASEWEHDENTPEAWHAAIRDYLPFAWDKANNRRGISANRSVMHFIAWMWLAGDVEASESLDHEFRTNYCYYGKPILRAISERYDVDWRTKDDGMWTDDEDSSGIEADKVSLFVITGAA